MTDKADISENELLDKHKEVFRKLLFDHTSQRNIIWATDSYADLGAGYGFHDEITIEKITGRKDDVIQPRSVKSPGEQLRRVKGMAEVFTPSWICNAQNNLVDEAWFGCKDVFNHEETLEDGTHSWTATNGPVFFPKGKTWRQYVSDNVMEITCGEAPYLVSRYDTVTGSLIPIRQRIGLLDRKLRVVSENVDNSGEWLKAAQKAYKSTYGYEWQGDSLLLARESLFFTFLDYYKEKFGRLPLKKSMLYIAYIISWNIFQMDGLKGVIPGSCKNGRQIVDSIFGLQEDDVTCMGCQIGDIRQHNGAYCIIRDWGHKDPETCENDRKIRFIDLIKH